MCKYGFDLENNFVFFVVPPNGLVIYCGTIVTDEGKEKKVNIDFEPFRPINTSLYLCDNKFHTEVRLLHGISSERNIISMNKARAVTFLLGTGFRGPRNLENYPNFAEIGKK